MSKFPIVCYHNVAMTPPEARLKLLYVQPDAFERQLWTLRHLGFRGVSVGEGLSRLQKASARGCIGFTFDDGYADNLTTAAPIMRQYGFAATCYVVSSTIGTYNSWDAEAVGERKPLMTHDQLDQWLAAGMEVGSHSFSHRRLGELSQEAAQQEIAESRLALQKLLAVPIEHFAYPFGSFSAETIELVRHAGYRSAVTVTPGMARAADDPLRLPRILVNGTWGLPAFLLHVTTPYERLRRSLA